MARLRLFGPAREAAGTASDEVAGSTVREILGIATERYGPGFAEVLQRSRVWVNGETASPDRAVNDIDEVAVLPPVSGG